MISSVFILTLQYFIIALHIVTLIPILHQLFDIDRIRNTNFKMPPQSNDSINHIPTSEKSFPDVSERNLPEGWIQRKSKIIMINGKYYDITDFNHPGKLDMII